MVFVKIGNYGCGMMSDERFSLSNSINHNPISNWVMIVHDDAEHKHMNAEEIVDFLNSLSEDNEQLKEKLEILENIIADVESSVGMDITNLIDKDMCGDGV